MIISNGWKIIFFSHQNDVTVFVPQGNQETDNDGDFDLSTCKLF